MDAIFVGKVSVAPKRHIPQIIEQLFVCPYCQLVEDCSQLVLLPSKSKKGERFIMFAPLNWVSFR